MTRKIFKKVPSITLKINGTEYKPEGVIKSKGLFYYEGNQEFMLIYEQSTQNIYMGAVDNIESLKPHGKGVLRTSNGTKSPA